MGNSIEQLEIRPSQRIAGNITAGVLLVLCGVFLLLTGLNVIPLKLSDLALPTILLTIGLTLIITAFIQKNTVSLWLSVMFLVPALISYLAAYTSLTYGNLYPFYIAMPGIASLATMLMSRNFSDHLKVAAFFGLPALIFCLNSFSLLGWNAVLPILVVYVGALIIYIAVSSKINGKKEDN